MWRDLLFKLKESIKTFFSTIITGMTCLVSTGFNGTSWRAQTQYWDLTHPDSEEGYHKEGCSETCTIRSQNTRWDPVLLCLRIELRAMGMIPESAELTVSYVDFLSVSADRQKKLKEHFHFECTCEHCSQHIKDDLMMATAEGNVSEGTRV